MILKCDCNPNRIKVVSPFRSSMTKPWLCDECRNKGAKSIVVQGKRLTVRSQRDTFSAFMHTARVVKR